MSDFSEFYRFSKQVNDTHTCDAIGRWYGMTEASRKVLRERWTTEDEKVKKAAIGEQDE